MESSYILDQILRYCWEKKYRPVCKMWRDTLDNISLHCDWCGDPKIVLVSRISPIIFHIQPDKIDWSVISKYYRFSTDFLARFADRIDWICYDDRLTLEQFIQFADHITNRSLGSYKLTEEEIESRQNCIDWRLISFSQSLSESFIEKWRHKVDWCAIIRGQKLSEEFIEKWMCKFDIQDVFQYQNVSEAFIEKYINRIGKRYILHTPIPQYVDDDGNHFQFDEVVMDPVTHNWHIVCQKQKLSESFIEKWSDRIEWNLLHVNQILSGDFLERHIEKIRWINIAWHRSLPEDFIRRHADQLDWNVIVRTQRLREDFVEECVSRLSWYDICSLQTISEKFITKWADRVDWRSISMNQRLSEKFMSDNRGRICWHAASIMQDMSDSFIRKFITRINIYNRIKKGGMGASLRNDMLEYYLLRPKTEMDHFELVEKFRIKIV